MKIHKVLENFYYGGVIDYPDEEHGIPFGYTRKAPPNVTLEENEHFLWIGSDWIKTTEPPPTIPAPPAAPKIISKLGFLNRLGDDYISILTASKSDVVVEAWINKFNLSANVDLNDAKTAEFMAMFVSKGLLTQEKVDKILQDPLLSFE